MKKIFILSFIILLNACCWRSPDSQFYTMESKDITKISNKNINVSVSNVKVPDLLDRPQMITYQSNGKQINIHEFNRWGEALPYVLQTTIINDLMGYMPKSYIKRAPFANVPNYYTVNVEINKIESYPNKEVRLSAWWNINDSHGKTLRKGQGFYKEIVKQDSIVSLVEAQNKAVNRLSKDIARQLISL